MRVIGFLVSSLLAIGVPTGFCCAAEVETRIPMTEVPPISAVDEIADIDAMLRQPEATIFGEFDFLRTNDPKERYSLRYRFEPGAIAFGDTRFNRVLIDSGKRGIVSDTLPFVDDDAWLSHHPTINTSTLGEGERADLQKQYLFELDMLRQYLLALPPSQYFQQPRSPAALP